MSAAQIAGVDPLFLTYLAAFALAALACWAASLRARRIDDPDTRRGLVWLLLTSGGWAGAQVVYLIAPWPPVSVGFYLVGLVVGLATIGPWLYFCSAFTGRSLHRDRTLQWTAVAVFLGVVAIKVTNAFHGLYFSATAVDAPFPHVAIELGTLHWLSMGFAYALAAVGYFMLFELFVQVDYDIKPLLALVAVTGLPAALDVISLSVPAILAVSYEPLGVAAFSIGVLYLFLDRLQAIQLASGRDEPVVLLDEDGEVRDYNANALELFPSLREAIGEPLASALPSLADSLAAGDELVTFDRPGGTQYYRLVSNPFGAGSADLGSLVVLSDVTEREQYRRELERQNERLEEFAGMVSHDLRNPLTVAVGRLEVARAESDSEHLETAADALDRMEALIEDVLALARQGQPVDETETVALGAIAGASWDMVQSDGATLEVADDLRFQADPARLQQCFENLFRNAFEHGGDADTVRVGALDGDGFYVEDDGEGIPAAERDEVFEYGFTTSEAGTGFGLGIVSEVVDAHGWTISVTEGADGGARFEVRGVTGVE
jgi:signal transduction histidine kinase